MKKILFFAAAALSLAACSNEGVITDGVDIPQPSEGTNLSFSLSLPNGTPVTYSGTVQHTDPERKIHVLDIYQFNGHGDDAKLEKVYKKVTTTETSADNYNANIFVETSGDKRFVLVTNNVASKPGYMESVANAQPNVTTFGAFKVMQTAALTTTPLNNTPLVMTFTHTTTITNGVPNPKVTAKLERIMARLDIRNEDNNFVIKTVKIVNSRDKAYLLPKDTEGGTGTDAAPTGFANTLPAVTLPENVSNANVGYQSASGITTYNHVFYPYPSNTIPVASGTTNAPMVEIKGVLTYATGKTTNVIYNYYLKKSDTEYLGFKRNTVYTLIIKKALSDKELDATIKVNSWKEDVIDAPYAILKTPELVGADNNLTVFTADIDNRVITVEKAGGEVVLHIDANNDWEVIVSELPEYVATADWFEGYHAGYDAGGSPKPNIKFVSYKERIPSDKLLSVMNDRLCFTLKANADTSARTTKLILRSKLNKNLNVELTVNQKG